MGEYFRSEDNIHWSTEELLEYSVDGMLCIRSQSPAPKSGTHAMRLKWGRASSVERAVQDNRSCKQENISTVFIVPSSSFLSRVCDGTRSPAYF